MTASQAASVSTLVVDEKSDQHMQMYMTMSLPELVEDFIKLASMKNENEGNALDKFDAAFTALLSRISRRDQVLETIPEADTKKLAEIRKRLELEAKNVQHSIAHYIFLSLLYRRNDVDGVKLGRDQNYAKYSLENVNNYLRHFPFTFHFENLFKGMIRYADSDVHTALTLFSNIKSQNLRLLNLYQGLNFLEGLNVSKNLQRAEELFKKAAELGEVMGAWNYIQCLIQKNPINKEEILHALIQFKRLRAIQNFSDPRYEIKDCGIEFQVNKDSKSDSLQVIPRIDINKFNDWLLLEMIKQNQGDQTIQRGSDIKHKIYLLLTKDKHVLVKAIRDAITSYETRKREKDEDYTDREVERHRNMLQAANLLLTIINLDESSTAILNALEDFAKIDSGRASENSMKFLIMNNILKFYAGESHDAIKPSWPHTRAGFSNGLMVMVKLGKKFNEDYLVHLQKQTEFEKQFVTVAPVKVEKDVKTENTVVVPVATAAPAPASRTSTATAFYGMQNAASTIQIEPINTAKEFLTKLIIESPDIKFVPAEKEKPKYPAWSKTPIFAKCSFAPEISKEEEAKQIAAAQEAAIKAKAAAELRAKQEAAEKAKAEAALKARLEAEKAAAELKAKQEAKKEEAEIQKLKEQWPTAPQTYLSKVSILSDPITSASTSSTKVPAKPVALIYS